MTDPSKATIADAKVAAVNTGTNFRYETATNGAGEYTWANLPPGTYRIEVEKSGFKKLVAGLGCAGDRFRNGGGFRLGSPCKRAGRCGILRTQPSARWSTVRRRADPSEICQYGTCNSWWSNEPVRNQRERVCRPSITDVYALDATARLWACGSFRRCCSGRVATPSAFRFPISHCSVDVVCGSHNLLVRRARTIVVFAHSRRTEHGVLFCRAAL